MTKGKRFRFMEVLFHLFRYHWGKENRSSYGGLRYIEVRYIEVPGSEINFLIWAPTGEQE